MCPWRKSYNLVREGFTLSFEEIVFTRGGDEVATHQHAYKPSREHYKFQLPETVRCYGSVKKERTTPYARQFHREPHFFHILSAPRNTSETYALGLPH
jgi:hypothetical protein